MGPVHPVAEPPMDLVNEQQCPTVEQALCFLGGGLYTSSGQQTITHCRELKVLA